MKLLRLLVRRCIASAILACVVLPASGAIQVEILRPSTGELVSNPLYVWYSIFSDSEILSATVDVDGRREVVTAFPGKSGSLTTAIRLEGLDRGYHPIVITAVNAAGESARAARDTFYSGAPYIELVEPTIESVARPNIRIRAKCSDGSPEGCKSISVWAEGRTLAEGVTDINQEISLAPYEGRAVTLHVFATGQKGWQGGVERDVYVDSSPRLKEISTFEGPILDVTSDRVVFLHPDGMLRIHHRATGQRTTIPPMPFFTPYRAFLTDRGAIFYAYRSGWYQNLNLCSGRIVEWSDGKLAHIDDSDSPSSFKVAGGAAIWARSYYPCMGGVTSSLFWRDLAGGATFTVSDYGYTYLTDLAPNGDLVYSLGDAQIRKFRSGVSTVLLDGSPSFHGLAGVATDGVNVAYAQRHPIASPQGYQFTSILLLTPFGLAPLAFQTVDAEKDRDYALNNGWAAYTVANTSGSKQVFVRLPGGDIQLRSVEYSAIDALGPMGSAMIVTPISGKRYLTSSSGSPRLIGSSLGKASVVNGQWTIAMGRTLFVVPMSVSVVKRGSGSGVVTSAPSGITCGSQCALGVETDSMVTLEATPEPGSQFMGWLGACTGRGPCDVLVSGEVSVSATFAPAATPARMDIDGDGDTGALTDGLLVLRHLFGVGGEQLTRSATGARATRTGSAAIAAWLDDIGPLLDIDSDGRIDALTDGLLLMRYLFGLRGDALTTGAIGAAAKRTASGQVEAYIASIL